MCAAVSHRGGCASHAGGLTLLSKTRRDIHTLCVDEPQVLLYLDGMKITPSNPRKAKPPTARVPSVEVPEAGADPDTSSEAPGAGVRPGSAGSFGIEFCLRGSWTKPCNLDPMEKLKTFLAIASNTLATWMAGRLRMRPP